MSRRRMKKMKLITVLCQLLLLYFIPSTAPNLITANMFEARGQRVCRVGKGKPCYKLAYFSEPRRRLNFGEAELACRRDGGELLSVESVAEQKIIEQLITELRPSDGDFWIGLHRNHGDQDSVEADCSTQYYWVDGSKSTFRNWHWDEPSCGYEVCVVMYHQPSAPPGLGGLYMFQWNDDNCETKNNFICKYTSEKTLDPSPSPNSTQTDALPTSILPWNPVDHEKNRTTALNLIYIILPTIPLLLLFLTVTGVCCYKLLVRRRKKQRKSEVCPTELGLCPSPTSTDVYNVIRLQNEDDLMATRPHTKNTSFLSQVSSPEISSPTTGDYDNLGGRDTESGFVTLASTESCFLNYDLNDLSLGRLGIREFCDTSSTHTAKKDGYDTSLTHTGKKDGYDTSLTHTGKDAYDTSVTQTGNKDAYERSLTRTGNKDAYDRSLTRTGKDTYDRSLTRTGKDVYDTSLTHTGKDAYDTRVTQTGNKDTYERSLTHTGNKDAYDRSLTHTGNKDAYDRSLTHTGNKDAYDRSLTRTGKDAYDTSFTRTGKDAYDRSPAHVGKRDSYDTSRTGKENSYETSLSRAGSLRESYDTSRTGKENSYETSLSRAGSLTRTARRDSYDMSLTRTGKRDSYDTSMTCSGKRDSYDRSLTRSAKRDSYDASLSRMGKRDMYDTNLSRSGNREMYDRNRSLGRRTAKSEHFGSGSYGEQMYEGSLGGRGEFYDLGLAPGGHTVKADIYQTYMSNGKEDTYQTSLGYYGNRKSSYNPNMDCYRNELVLGSGRRYFNETEWVNNNNY